MKIRMKKKNGSNWEKAGPNNYNTASTINETISKFSVENN